MHGTEISKLSYARAFSASPVKPELHYLQTNANFLNKKETFHEHTWCTENREVVQYDVKLPTSRLSTSLLLCRADWFSDSTAAGKLQQGEVETAVV